MPTPSPNQPPDQPPSASSHPFSSCPEDMLHSPRNDRDSADGETNRLDRSSPDPDSSVDGPAPPLFEHDRSQITRTNIDVSSLDGGMPATPSSRATTVSPPPQSNMTGVTSPEPSGAELSRTPKTQGPVFDGLPHSTARTGPSRSPSSTSRDLATAESDLYGDDDMSCSPPSMGSEYSCIRTLPLAPSSFLRPGSKFHGTQQSERQVYDVQVEIKHVDMRESFLCGYLRIQGLTEDHPTLTTYFEGEIIGSKYNFYTQHEDWGANMKVDLSHWAKFSAFRPLQKYARKGPITIPDVTQKDHIFMRWKEHFLVPDHRVRTITGASFEGFYYICFNQLKGEVSGIYFHSKSEKFQQLELKHVPNRGCFSATEFR